MMPALTNVQLEDILRYDPVLSFGGVLPYDHIPHRVGSYPCGFIFNTDDSDNPGMHWISLYFDKKQDCQYFCPLGTEPYGLLFDFAERNSRRTYYNQTTLQHPLSSLCGYYCVYHLMHATRGYTLYDVVSQFSQHKWASNDQKVFDFIHGWVEAIVDL